MKLDLLCNGAFLKLKYWELFSTKSNEVTEGEKVTCTDSGASVNDDSIE